MSVQPLAHQPLAQVRRPPLRELPRDDMIVLQAPPMLPRGGGGGGTQMLFMLPMMLGMGAMSFTYIGRSGGPATFIFGALYIGAMVGMMFMSLSRGGASKKAQINDERRDYLRYLSNMRNQVRQVAAIQREYAEYEQPSPADLWTVVGSEQMWSRRRRDATFGLIRVATGPQLLRTNLVPPATAPLDELDPVCSTSLRHFLRTYASVSALPSALPLRRYARVGIAGPRGATVGLARAIVAQLAAFHDPRDMRLALCLGRDQYPDWEWAKWLPHALDPGRLDAAGPVRLCAGTLSELVELMDASLGDRMPFVRDAVLDGDLPHIVIVADGGYLDAHELLDPMAGRVGVTIIDLAGVVGGPNWLNLFIANDLLGRLRGEDVVQIGEVDRLSRAGAEAVARQLTPFYQHSPVRDDGALSGNFGLPELLGVGDPRRIDPAVTWRPRAARERLRLPIGLDPDGRPVELDIKEAAENGMGPHGLVIGATGSGKSELLRTIVMGLALTHSSESLNLALIDFKGGATFAGMTTLPHTCAVITNLSAELSLVDRMGDALDGEMVRRQELLRAAGNFASVRDYEKARADGATGPDGAPLKPLPSLLVIIDEFSELLSSRPEFVDLFVAIGRLGRSLAVHLMFASQRLEEGRLRGLESHLSYRIGLKTFSPQDSRAVLGVPDAYELPSLPGSGFLKTDTSTLIRFKAAYVSGEIPRTGSRGGNGNGSSFGQAIVPYTLAPAIAPPPGLGSELEAPVNGGITEPDDPSETIMGAIVSRLEGKGTPAHQIWLPPLAEPPSLDQILPPLAVSEVRGLCPDNWVGNGRLHVPIAIVDKPREQRRDLLWADLSGAAGHVMVVGAPQSGKSTLLRTLVTTLALTHTPREVQFFVLDFGGGSLMSLAGLPHVSGCATRLDEERCRRIVAELTGLLMEREQLFANSGIDSITTFRQNPRPAEGGRLFGDIFLIVDGWMTLRQDYEQLEEQVTNLAARGLGYGIHVLISANRYMEVRSNVSNMIGTQFELRLGDTSDSTIDRKAAANVPAGRPGRGLTREKLHFLVALPRIDGRQNVGDLGPGVADLVRRVSEAWPADRAPAVRLLPRELPVTALPVATPGDRRVPIGIAEADLAPVYLDFDTDPHFLAFGDSECGKTGLLRLIALGLVERYTPAEAAIMVVDYRRGLLGVVPPAHLLLYAGAEPAIDGAMGEIVALMRSRMPGPDISAEQLRARSWWKGSELFILVDDYDLVVNPAKNPLAALHEFLPQARDIGLHLIIVRRAGGASRALFEPVLQRMRDLSTPGLAMSAPKDEGVLLGDVKSRTQVPGRGHLVSRRTGSALIQVAWQPPVE